ncbi:hypothetical protein SAMN04515674_101431 [Pseudarcicella hirudinis]|uniref:Uncharacterized protein n=1 Tax=Pseudarcicella hirudinis TaxID=1079859 RepID=A0A1I5MU51_9BACT|nr:hypothetical protein SAMN04515674_101431 [Pseudarcicella hirudinis]
MKIKALLPIESYCIVKHLFLILPNSTRGTIVGVIKDYSKWETFQ